MYHFGRLASTLTGSLVLILSLHTAAAARCEWTLFPTIDPYPTGNQLNGIAGTGPSDVWETGDSYQASASYGYALHWNGTGWTSYLQSNASTYGGQLSRVVEPAAGDVWTVGARYQASGYSNPIADLEHWTGSGFSAVTPPAGQDAFTYLYGATALSASDIWAVGGSQPASGTEVSYVIHYSGSAWSTIAAPNVAGMSTNLDAVAGSSANNVWSVGDAYGNPSTIYAPLAEHWNGTSWSIVATPGRSGQSGRLNAVTAVSPSDAWAVGETVKGSTYAALVEHWNGTLWQIVPSPDPHGGSIFLLGVTAVSANEVWAVGEVSKGAKNVLALAMRWNGKAWKIVPSQNVRKRPVTLLNAVASVPSAGLWAVGGDASTKAVVDTVTERYACPKEAHVTHR